MKKAKLIIGLIIFSLVFVFIGETYSWYIDSFETEYDYITMYKEKHITQNEMLEDIIHNAKEANVDIFVVERKIESFFSLKLTIYGTRDVENHLRNESKIQSGTFPSIFLGKIKVDIRSIKEIPDVDKVETYYMIGNKENILRFKQKTVDKYSGKFPQEGYISLNSDLNITLIWIVSLFLLLLVTLYEIAQLRKEVIVRIVSGQRIQDIVKNNIFIDILIYSALFVSITIIFSFFTEVYYCFFISIISFVIFLIINSLIYCLLFITDYKKRYDW